MIQQDFDGTWSNRQELGTESAEAKEEGDVQIVVGHNDFVQVGGTICCRGPTGADFKP